MSSITEKVKGAVHNVKEKITHKDEKAAHKADEEGHKDAAKGGFGQAKDDVKDAAVHAKDAAGAKVDKNKAEAGQKIGKDQHEAENLAIKEGKKGQESAHKDVADEKLGHAWENIKGGTDHTKDAAHHKAEKNKIEGQEKVDNARAKTSSKAGESAA